MRIFNELISNQILITGIVAWFIAQGYKIIATLVKEKRFNLERIMGSGGMPSSHTTSSVAVTFGIGQSLGYDSPMFALAFVFSFIVMYDAANVRMETGKQARVINEMIDEILKGDSSIKDVKLKELLGHTYLEVFVGFILGIIIGVLMNMR